MACGCGRSPDFCRGWHALSEAEWQAELLILQAEQVAEKPAADKHVVMVKEVQHYTDTLFRFVTDKPVGYTFKAGEFVMIGLGDKVRRAYSITSAPHDPILEFYSIKVPDGALTSRLKNIQPGDTVEVGAKATGTLLLENLKPGRRLWLLATGTGIAPFMSLVRQRDIFNVFAEVNVAWSVREQDELKAYRADLTGYDLNLFPIVTRDELYIEYQKRITELIDDKVLLGEMDPQHDRVMLCGSMEFNEDLKRILDANGFAEGNTGTPGDYVVEKAFVG